MIALREALALCGIGAAVMFYGPAKSLAEEVSNVSNGLAYARAHCAECHAVEKGDNTIVNSKAPDFPSVANTPGMTGRALAVWLQTSHPTMPNFIIPTEARNDVIAYIMSLKTLAPR